MYKMNTHIYTKHDIAHSTQIHIMLCQEHQLFQSYENKDVLRRIEISLLILPSLKEHHRPHNEVSSIID